MPHSRRIAGAARSQHLLARAPLLRREYQSHQRSGSLVQVELSAAHGRQKADRNPGQPRPDQTAARAIQAVDRLVADPPFLSTGVMSVYEKSWPLKSNGSPVSRASA